MNLQEVSQALNWRYAVKKFDPQKKISPQDWQVLKQSLILTPTSYGLEPYHFVLVESVQLREKLKAVSWNQSQVVDCSHYVVFTAKEAITEEDVESYIKRVAATREVSEESLKGFKDMLLKGVVHGMPKEYFLGWNQRQAYIAMGFLLETAALLKVDATPMEGLDPKKYDELLGLSGSGLKTVAAVALGYRHPEDKYQNLKKVRKSEAELFSVRS